ncbi:MAG: hypothetical protein IIB08_02625 [Bacteroidetes bacterium]|nr:hypothetical protein [Bacteroidota bacterium]
MTDLNETISKLQEQIKEYNEIKSTNNIPLLLDVKDRICIWSFRFAELTADLKISYNDHYFIRRINVAKTRQTLIKNGSTIGAADNDALIKHEESYKAEQEYESLSYKADIMLRQTNIIIRTIEQRISYLKFEANKLTP